MIMATDRQLEVRRLRQKVVSLAVGMDQHNSQGRAMRQRLDTVQESLKLLEGYERQQQVSQRVDENTPSCPIVMLTTLQSSLSPQRIIMNHNSHLLRLPAELRNRIYKLVLPEGKLISMWKNQIPEEDLADALSARACVTTISILRVCHQTRVEAIPIFCGTNEFVFGVDAGSYGETMRRIDAMDVFAIASTRQLHLHQYFSPCCAGAKSRPNFDIRRSVLAEKLHLRSRGQFCARCEHVKSPSDERKYIEKVLEGVELQKGQRGITRLQLKQLITNAGWFFKAARVVDAD